LKANQTKKKDKKDKKKVKTSAPDLSVESAPVTSKHAIEAVVEDLSDGESRSVEAKKQGKKKGEVLVEEVAHLAGVSFRLSSISFLFNLCTYLIFLAEELQITATAQEEFQDSDPKILSKKEKEKLKKEREKVWQVSGTL